VYSVQAGQDGPRERARGKDEGRQQQQDTAIPRGRRREHETGGRKGRHDQQTRGGRTDRSAAPDDDRRARESLEHLQRRQQDQRAKQENPEIAAGRPGGGRSRVTQSVETA
jgi:hypothetical protein